MDEPFGEPYPLCLVFWINLVDCHVVLRTDNVILDIMDRLIWLFVGLLLKGVVLDVVEDRSGGRNEVFSKTESLNVV